MGRRCTVAAWVETLPAEEAAAVRTALRPKGKPAHKVADTLREYGFPISPSTINGHRRGECQTCRSLTT